jgi:NhaB family Na+:H+ antiporter
MTATLAQVCRRSFLGHAPRWYKVAIGVFLVANPLLLWVFGAAVAGWAVLLEFIFTLGMALKCYPLQPGGLLAIEAVAIGLTSAESVSAEVLQAFPVILLLIFMVAGIYFLRELLLFIFTRLLVNVRSSTLLALLFCGVSALLSAFLDALTVVAVIVTVGLGFYEVYHRVASGKGHDAAHDATADEGVAASQRETLDQFRAFLRGLMMHAVVGTAIGGVTTQVGEPQNLLIAGHAGWNFAEFFLAVAPVSIPVAIAGLVTCGLVDRLRWFGYGTRLPDAVRAVLTEQIAQQAAQMSARDRYAIAVQAVVAMTLVLSLAFHIAEVGLIGLTVIVLATALTGITDEHRLGRAFEAALPFTGLIVVFFAIVAVIHDQHLFEPLMRHVLGLEGRLQASMLYLATGALSAISDNVFVATIYITEIKAAYLSGAISGRQFEWLAIAINTGTNIPSVATPNGQAAFLFMLTSTLAPLIRLGYLRMTWMALPYFVTMTVTGWLALTWLN